MDPNRQMHGGFPIDKSPLRRGDIPSTIGQQQHMMRQGNRLMPPGDASDEDQFNRRRQDPARKQLQYQKEANIAQQQPFRFKATKVQNDQPSLRQMNQPPYEHPQQQFQQYPGERDNAPHTHFTLGPQASQPDDGDGVPPHIKEHLSNLQNDNSSLMRRLNLVLQELERVKREREDLSNLLERAQGEQHELHRMLNNEDNVDKVNKYMQDDLDYERERNQKLKQQIKELDLYKNQLIRDLRKLGEHQEGLVKDNSDQSYTLQARMSQIEDLEKEHYFTLDKIKAVNLNIDNLKHELLGDDSDKDELQRILNQLLQERNDLLQKLDHLGKKYEECVKEISMDRAEMESHNNQHSKLITSKILFQTLEGIHRNRLMVGFSEFKSYCIFDGTCHNKLRKIAKILESAGKIKMRIALTAWFSNALKPTSDMQRSDLLSGSVNSIALKNKMFSRWRSLYKQRQEGYEQKNKGVKLVFQRLENEAKIESKRAFKIWKEDVQNHRLQKAKIKKLIWKCYFNRLSDAMNTWANFSSHVDGQVRLGLLAKTFSQKQYMTLLFHNFRYQTTEAKRKRVNILFHCLKAWKDHLAYEKFVMGSNLLALQFKGEINLSLVKACFDAMKQNKEKEKFQKTSKTLNEDERPKIEVLSQETESIMLETHFKAKNKACETVKKMMASKLQGYFTVWKKVNEDYKEKLRTTIKDKVIKCSMSLIRTAFNLWKVKHNEGHIEQHEMAVQELQSEQHELQDEVMSMQKQIKEKQDQRDCCSQKGVLKCVKSYERRLIQLALGRWRDKVGEMNVKEDGSATILKRLRLRFLRQAFDLYLAGVKYTKKLQVEEDRCEQYMKTRNERIKAKVYNKWNIYKDNHKRAKNYWNRIFLRLELSMKQAAVRKWKEGSQRRVEFELQEHQEQTIQQIENLNNQVGQMHLQEVSQQNDIKDMKGTLTSQAQRIIANAFARFYYTNETRGFEKWKDYVQFEKQKEKLLKKYIDHYRKRQFQLAASALKTWILNTKINERKDEVKKEEQRVADAQLQLQLQEETFEATKNQLNSECEQVKQMQVLYNDRIQKSVQMIIDKVDHNHCTSQKRYILQQWRDYVKREVRFINAIKNVIQKSLWNKGFQEIKQFKREVQQQTHLSDTLNKFRLKFWKRTCGNAFSVWRSGQFAMIMSTIVEVEAGTQSLKQEHKDKKALIKKNNANRAEKLIVGQNLRNLFHSWKSVSSHLKQHRITTSHCNKMLDKEKMKNALRRWNSRKNATKVAQVRMHRLREKFYQIRLRFYFNALRDQFSITSSLCDRLANLATINNHQGLKAGFNAIMSFAKSKAFVHQQMKQNSTQSLQVILEGIVHRRKKIYLNDLRLRCLNKKKIEQTKAFTILQSVGNQMRYFFTKWKCTSNEKSLAKEMNEEGPIREEIFEDKQQLKNLKALMTQEGYDEQDIAKAMAQEKERQSGLLLKGVRRMQHYNEELYLKPKVLDRWKQYVHMKKLFRYWLGFAEKRGEYVKCDVHKAFDTWKSFYGKQVEALQKLPKTELDKRMVQNGKKMDELCEVMEDKDTAIDSLNHQRDTLVDHFIKSQKLALSLWVNYNKRSLHQAFLRWSRQAQGQKTHQATDQLRANLDLLANLKDRIAQLERDNEFLADENEELRQFSLDGYQIAKSVQALTAEREKLSVDLADKANMIRKLLDENEKLTGTLRTAQDEASTLIKSTMAGSSGFKTGMKSMMAPGRNAVFTPLTKSSNY